MPEQRRARGATGWQKPVAPPSASSRPAGLPPRGGASSRVDDEMVERAGVSTPPEDSRRVVHERDLLREALEVLPPYLKAANAGDTGAIPLALDIIKATLSEVPFSEKDDAA